MVYAAEPPIPKTARGTADLTGVWTNRTGAPLENRWTQDPLATAEPDPTDTGFRTTRRQDLVEAGGSVRIDRDGLTSMTPAGMARAVAGEAIRQRRGEADSWRDRNTWERCLTRGMPPMMLPEAQADHYLIADAGDVIAIHAETLHETRLIQVDPPDRPDPRRPRTRLGRSRGTWLTARTLRITTDRFTVDATDNLDNSQVPPAQPIPGQARGPGHRRRTVETVTMRTADVVDYRLELDEPDTVAETVVYQLKLHRVTNNPIVYPYDCHEQNRSMPTILRGARLDEDQSVEASRRQSRTRLAAGHPGTAGPALPFRVEPAPTGQRREPRDPWTR